MKNLIFLLAVCGSMAGCCTDKRGSAGQEWEAQMKQAQAQMDSADRQAKRTDEQQAKAEEQQQRMDKVLGKWEEQGKRLDAILDRLDKTSGTNK